MALQSMGSQKSWISLSEQTTTTPKALTLGELTL